MGVKRYLYLLSKGLDYCSVVNIKYFCKQL